jgi:DNA-binding CsgD family transcriptional regulator
VLEAGEAVLDAIGIGLVMLAADGVVVFTNRSADDIAHAGDGLSCHDSRLTASNALVDAVLQRIVARAIAPGDVNGCQHDLLVARPSGRLPYHVTATPLRRNTNAPVSTRTPVALVLISDPERQRLVGADALKQAFNLTSREALLARLLAEGQSLQAAAERMRMRYETARTHLRHVLSKTGTSRQAELVGLVERLSCHAIDTRQSGA